MSVTGTNRNVISGSHFNLMYKVFKEEKKKTKGHINLSPQEPDVGLQRKVKRSLQSSACRSHIVQNFMSLLSVAPLKNAHVDHVNIYGCFIMKSGISTDTSYPPVKSPYNNSWTT